MTETHGVVFLFDAGNTLLDNDRIQADLGEHLENCYCPRARNRYRTCPASASVEGLGGGVSLSGLARSISKKARVNGLAEVIGAKMVRASMASAARLWLAQHASCRKNSLSTQIYERL